MKNQRTVNRDQKSEDLKRLLRRAVSPIGDDPEAPLDLWPAMQRRLEAETLRSGTHAASGSNQWRAALAGVHWFDWALAGGLVIFAVVSPVLIPVLLYYF